MTEQLKVVSFGAGVQSTALLVLAAQGRIPHRPFLFANVGDDSEHPATLAYLRDVAVPWAATHGITIHELHRKPNRGYSKGKVETLMGRLMREDSRSISIPVRVGDTGAPGNRQCTGDFKIDVVSKWIAAAGATADNPARVAIGISTDEYERATSRRLVPAEISEYPLLELGYSRTACKRLIAEAGLTVPPKSSCFFCPFHKPQHFADMARTDPDLFAKTCDLEDTLNARRDKLGKDHVYITRYGRPLRDVFATTQMAMFDDWDADEGYRCGDRCDT